MRGRPQCLPRRANVQTRDTHWNDIATTQQMTPSNQAPIYRRTTVLSIGEISATDLHEATNLTSVHYRIKACICHETDKKRRSEKRWIARPSHNSNKNTRLASAMIYRKVIDGITHDKDISKITRELPVTNDHLTLTRCTQAGRSIDATVTPRKSSTDIQLLVALSSRRLSAMLKNSTISLGIT